MTVYGITPQGFNRKTATNVLDEIQADQLADIGDDFDNSTPSIPGQMNGIVARQVGMTWEQLEILYNGMDPDAAPGRLLEFLGKLTGTARRGSTPSKVTMSLNLDLGTALTPGTHFAGIKDHPDVRWTPSLTQYPTGYVAGVAGQQPVIFESELLGPIQGLAGTITVISTPVTGWNTAVNPDDAELGQQPDNDAILRLRRETEIATIGSATVPSIAANISQAFNNKLESLIVFENEGDNVNADGLPPHSLEVLIFDGDVPTISNDDLALVILRSKAGGVATVGNTTGHASALVNGVTINKPVYFSRATQLAAYLEFQIVKNPDEQYAGDAAFLLAVATLANAYFGPGDDIVGERLKSFGLTVPGVKDVPVLKIGLLPNPFSVDNVPVTIREIARFSTSRIVVGNFTG